MTEEEKDRLVTMISSDDVEMRNLGMVLLLSRHPMSEWDKVVELHADLGYLPVGATFRKGEYYIFRIYIESPNYAIGTTLPYLSLGDKDKATVIDIT